MSLSAVALANPVSYQTNVLAACQNTVQEWRSIRKHYSNTTTRTATDAADAATYEMSISRMDEQTVRTTGQAIFELVQQSLQCGPLAGAQPGYFKRCGTETAQLVQNYLDTIVLTNMDENGMDHNNHHHDAVTVLGFTAKQAAAIVTWQRNAQKAAEKSEQPPSRSVLARRDKAVSNTNKKCKK